MIKEIIANILLACIGSRILSLSSSSHFHFFQHKTVNIFLYSMMCHFYDVFIFLERDFTFPIGTITLLQHEFINLVDKTLLYNFSNSFLLYVFNQIHPH